jgi:hypothetical protein
MSKIRFILQKWKKLIFTYKERLLTFVICIIDSTFQNDEILFIEKLEKN